MPSSFTIGYIEGVVSLVFVKLIQSPFSSCIATGCSHLSGYVLSGFDGSESE